MQWIQLILALSLLVVIHELGHFCFARIFKVRVEKFYMFFNPKFSLIRAKKINGKWQVRFFAPNVEPSMVSQQDAMGNELKDEKGNTLYRPMTDEELATLPEEDWRRYPDNTEWGIGWVPFGGYCAIAGMVDETKDATSLPSEPQPWEFRAKNVWQRLCIIIGGILVNFVAALAIFSMILFHWGQDTLPLRNVSTGLYYAPILVQEGFQQQDKLLSINGVETQDINEFLQSVVIEGQRDILVLRGEDTVALTMSEDLSQRCLALLNDYDAEQREKARADKSYHKKRYTLISFYAPFVIDSVMSGGAASFADMQKGDRVVGVNGVHDLCYVQVMEELAKYPCDSVTLDFYRGDELKQARLFIGDQAKIGVFTKNPISFYPIEHKDFSFFESISAGITHGWDFLLSYIKQFRVIFTKEGICSLNLGIGIHFGIQLLSLVLCLPL